MTIPAPRHAPFSRRTAHDRTRSSAPTERRSLGSTIGGGIGELLITLGVLGLLFVVWELWWTGIEAESDRQDALDEFYAQMPAPAQSAGPDPDGDDAASAAGPGSADPGSADPSSADAASADPGSADAESAVPVADFETCYTLEDGTEIGCAPAMAELAAQGEVMGTLYAPRLGDDWAAPVREGVTAEQIDRGGVGRYPDTQLPDEPGNFAVAGHRNTHASMLGRQDDLEVGDRIYLVSPDGMYTYQVSERHVVAPQQTEVLAPVPHETGVEPETGTLTLTTCHPMYSNAERLIHHASIIDFTPLGGPAAEELVHHEPIREMFYAGGAG